VEIDQPEKLQEDLKDPISITQGESYDAAENLEKESESDE